MGVRIPVYNNVKLKSGVEISFKISTLDVNFVWVPPSLNPPTGNKISFTGRHIPCGNNLKYYDGLVICEECNLVIDM